MGPPILRHIRKIRRWRCNVCHVWVMGYRCPGCLHNPWVPPGPMSTERNQKASEELDVDDCDGQCRGGTDEADDILADYVGEAE